MTSLSLTQISLNWKISIRNTKKQLNKLFLILLKINSTVVNFKQRIEITFYMKIISSLTVLCKRSKKHPRLFIQQHVADVDKNLLSISLYSMGIRLRKYVVRILNTFAYDCILQDAFLRSLIGQKFALFFLHLYRIYICIDCWCENGESNLGQTVQFSFFFCSFHLIVLSWCRSITLYDEKTQSDVDFE